MLLNSVLRPLVKFNPSNKEHRAHYAKFLAEGTWGSCPVRFCVDGDDAANNNLVYVMQRVLLEYYVTKEFKSAVKAHW